MGGGISRTDGAARDRRPSASASAPDRAKSLIVRGSFVGFALGGQRRARLSDNYLSENLIRHPEGAA